MKKRNSNFWIFISIILFLCCIYLIFIKIDDRIYDPKSILGVRFYIRLVNAKTAICEVQKDSLEHTKVINNNKNYFLIIRLFPLYYNTNILRRKIKVVSYGAPSCEKIKSFKFYVFDIKGSKIDISETFKNDSVRYNLKNKYDYTNNLNLLFGKSAIERSLLFLNKRESIDTNITSFQTIYDYYSNIKYIKEKKDSYSYSSFSLEFKNLYDYINFFNNPRLPRFGYGQNVFIFGFKFNINKISENIKLAKTNCLMMEIELDDNTIITADYGFSIL